MPSTRWGATQRIRSTQRAYRESLTRLRTRTRSSVPSLVWTCQNAFTCGWRRATAAAGTSKAEKCVWIALGGENVVVDPGGGSPRRPPPREPFPDPRTSGLGREGDIDTLSLELLEPV